MGDQQPPFSFIPGRVQDDAEPACQPFKRFRRRAAHIEKHLHGGDLVFNRGVETFQVREEAVEERSRFALFTINRREIVFEIREARIVSAQRPQSRRQAAIAAKGQLQFNEAPARALKQQFPRATVLL